MTEQTQAAKPERHAKVKRTYDVANMAVVSTFTDGTVRTLKMADLPDNINKLGLLMGVGTRIGQSASKSDTVAAAIAAYDEDVKQLTSGTWSEGPQANPANKLAEAFVQLAKEQNKVLTLKAAREQIAEKEKASPGWAAAKITEEKMQSAYARSQAKAEASLDDLG